MIALISFGSTLFAGYDEALSAPMPASMSLKEKVMAYWYGLSSMHKYVLLGVLAVALVWILWCFFKRKDGCCGCDCSGSCNC